MTKSYKAVAAEIQRGEIAPIYLIVGEEAWSRKKFMTLLKQTLIDPSMEDFNYEHLHAAEARAINVVDKAGELPVMADRRLLVVEGCQQWKDKDLKNITGYLKQINDKTCLVLQFDEADRRRKLFQGRTNGVRLLEFAKPKRWELNDYVRGLARDMGLRLSSDAVVLVAELAGDDLARVHQELEKLSLYKLGANDIGAEDVEAVVGRTRQATRWELNDVLGTRDLHQCLLKLRHILDSGEDAISLLSAVNMFVRQMYAVKSLIISGVRDKFQIAQMIHLPPKIAERLIEQQKAYSNVELRNAFQLMRQTDRRLKTAHMDRDLLLDHLVTRIVSRGPYSPPQRRRSRR